jgi:hypothetical protein
LDRDEWLRATRTLRRWIFFWKGVPRPREADESLAALLNRREQVRSQRAAPVAAPSPELFRPQQEAPVPEAGLATEEKHPGPEAAPGSQEAKPPSQPVSTASRLLDAKRRAQKRK